jgi:hypothetical protein
VLIRVGVLGGSSGSLGAGIDVTPSAGEVAGVVGVSSESMVGVAVAVAVSVAEVGAVEESTELVVGLGDIVSVAVVVGAAESVGLAVGETVVSEAVGAVEVSATGAVASVVVGAAVSVGLAVGETVVSEVVGAVEVSATGAVASVTVAVVSVAVSRRSLTVPPFQSVAISFAIPITQFPSTAERGNNAGRRPLDVGEIP